VDSGLTFEVLEKAESTYQEAEILAFLLEHQSQFKKSPETFESGTITLKLIFLSVQVIKTGFQNFSMDWTNNGNLLAVAGKSKEIACRSDHTIRYINMVHFYNENGGLILRSRIPFETVKLILEKVFFCLKLS
jgi:hypothetical protein